MKTIKKHLQAVIFDMDGTIIDSDHVWNAAMDDLFRKYQLDTTKACPEKYDTFRKGLGMGLGHSLEHLREAFDLAHVKTEEMKEHIVLTAKGMFKSHEVLSFIKGFEAFHKRLREAGIPSSIATNCDIHSLAEIVERLKFGQYFGENIYCLDHVGNKAKPDPAMFLHAAEKLGANPEYSLVFEDSIWGFKAAHAANMKCIAVKHKRNESFRNEHSHGQIDSYDDADQVIVDLVEKHFIK